MSILVRGNGDLQRKEEIRQNCCHQHLRIHRHFSRNKLQQYDLQLLRYGSTLSVDQWTKGLRSCDIYMYTTHTLEYYSVIKNVVAETWMDLEGIMLSETNQTDKYMYV